MREEVRIEPNAVFLLVWYCKDCDAKHEDLVSIPDTVTCSKTGSSRKVP